MDQELYYPRQIGDLENNFLLKTINKYKKDLFKIVVSDELD